MEWLWGPTRSKKNRATGKAPPGSVSPTSRSEIIIEGSDDGVAWRAYEFKYKPGDVKRRPRFVEPHQPRLDWQMWFAALGTYRQNPWLINCSVRLLQGSPRVLALFERN